METILLTFLCCCQLSFGAHSGEHFLIETQKGEPSGLNDAEQRQLRSDGWNLSKSERLVGRLERSLRRGNWKIRFRPGTPSDVSLLDSESENLLNQKVTVSKPDRTKTFRSRRVYYDWDWEVLSATYIPRGNRTVKERMVVQFGQTFNIKSSVRKSTAWPDKNKDDSDFDFTLAQLGFQRAVFLQKATLHSSRVVPATLKQPTVRETRSFQADPEVDELIFYLQPVATIFVYDADGKRAPKPEEKLPIGKALKAGARLLFSTKIYLHGFSLVTFKRLTDFSEAPTKRRNSDPRRYFAMKTELEKKGWKVRSSPFALTFPTHTVTAIQRHNKPVRRLQKAELRTTLLVALPPIDAGLQKKKVMLDLGRKPNVDLTFADAKHQKLTLPFLLTEEPPNLMYVNRDRAGTQTITFHADKKSQRKMIFLTIRFELVESGKVTKFWYARSHDTAVFEKAREP